MNDNEPVAVAAPAPSYPLAPDVAKHIAKLLAQADGKRSLERLLSELALLPSYQVVAQDNGMMALARAGGEGSMLLIPTATLIPMMAETILKFMVPSALHGALRPGMSEEEMALILAGGKK
jgi:hypothetical protein